MSRGPVSRRQVLRGAALVGTGFVAAGLSGCRREEKPAAPPGAPAVKQPKQGGILTQTQDITGTPIFDPNVDSPVIAAYWRLFYQGLLGYNLRTFEVEPELAEKWEQPSETEYIFTLAPTIKWQNKPPVNGRAFTVEDAVFGLERVRTNSPRFTSRPLLDGVKIEAVGKTRLKLTTKSPDAVFLNKLSGDGLTMVSKEVAERSEPGFGRPDLIVGTGPFLLKSFEEKVGAEVVRNPDYWKPGLPYLDGLRTVARNQGHGNERSWAAFQSGQVDVTVIPGNEVKNYLAQRGPGFQPEWVGDLTPYNIVPNVRVKPFDDARVTKALRLLVDHDEAISAWAELFVGRGRHGSFLPANLDAWDLTHEEYARLPEWKQPKDDAIREALALLSAAGFTRDNPLRFELTVATTPTFAQMGLLLQGQYRRLGQGVIETQIRQLEGTAYQTARANRDYAFMMSSNATSYFDPDAWFFQVYYSGSPRNYWNYSDPKLDAMFEKQRTLFDLRQRKAAVRETLLHMIETWPGTGITSAYGLNALKPQVRNFAPELWFNGRQYERVWLDT